MEPIRYGHFLGNGQTGRTFLRFSTLPTPAKAYYIQYSLFNGIQDFLLTN
jgi:hypothetical protein